MAEEDGGHSALLRNALAAVQREMLFAGEGDVPLPHFLNISEDRKSNGPQRGAGGQHSNQPELEERLMRLLFRMPEAALPIFPAPVAASHVHILLDTSSSMFDMLSDVRSHVLGLARLLHALDIRVSITAFSNTTRTFDGGPQPSPAFLHDVEAWLSTLVADGLTCTREALDTALHSGADAVVLITDGLPTSPPSQIVRLCRHAIGHPQGPWVIAPVYLHDDGNQSHMTPLPSASTGLSNVFGHATYSGGSGSTSMHHAHLAQSVRGLGSQANRTSTAPSLRTWASTTSAPSSWAPHSRGTNSSSQHHMQQLPPSCDPEATAFLDTIAACCGMRCRVLSSSQLRAAHERQHRHHQQQQQQQQQQHQQQSRSTLRSLPAVEALVRAREEEQRDMETRTEETRRESGEKTMRKEKKRRGKAAEKEVKEEGQKEQEKEEAEEDNGGMSTGALSECEDDQSQYEEAAEEEAAEEEEEAEEEAHDESGLEEDADERATRASATSRDQSAGDDSDVHERGQRQQRSAVTVCVEDTDGSSSNDDHLREDTTHAGARAVVHSSAVSAAGASVARGADARVGGPSPTNQSPEKDMEANLDRILGLRVLCFHDGGFRAGRVLSAMRPEGSGAAMARVRIFHHSTAHGHSEDDSDGHDYGDDEWRPEEENLAGRTLWVKRDGRGEEDVLRGVPSSQQILAELSELIPATPAGLQALYALVRQKSVYIPSIILRRGPEGVDCKLFSGKHVNNLPLKDVVGISLDQFATCVSAIVHATDSHATPEVLAGDEGDHLPASSPSPSRRRQRRARSHGGVRSPLPSRSAASSSLSSSSQRSRAPRTGRSARARPRASSSTAASSSARSKTTSISNKPPWIGTGAGAGRRGVRFHDSDSVTRSPPTRAEMAALEEEHRREMALPYRRHRTQQRMREDKRKHAEREEKEQARVHTRSRAKEERDARQLQQRKQRENQIEYSERRRRQDRRMREEKLREVEEKRADQQERSIARKRHEELERNVGAVLKQVDAEETERIRLLRRRENTEIRRLNNHQKELEAFDRQQRVEEAAQARTQARMEREELTRSSHLARVQLRTAVRRERELTRRQQLQEKREEEMNKHHITFHEPHTTQRQARRQQPRDRQAEIAESQQAEGTSMLDTLTHGRTRDDEENARRQAKRLEHLKRTHALHARREQQEAREAIALRSKQLQHVQRDTDLQTARAVAQERDASRQKQRQAQTRSRHEALVHRRRKEARREAQAQYEHLQRHEEARVVHRENARDARAMEERVLAAQRTRERREHQANVRNQQRLQRMEEEKYSKQVTRARHFAGRAHEGYLVLSSDQRIMP